MNDLDLTRIKYPKYLSSETQVIITPVALVMVEQFMWHLEPIRKQQDFLELIVKSKACSSHSITFNNLAACLQLAIVSKYHQHTKNTKIPGMCLLMLAISSTHNAKSNGDNTERCLTQCFASYVVLIWLSAVPVQVIDWKDTSPK